MKLTKLKTSLIINFNSTIKFKYNWKKHLNFHKFQQLSSEPGIVGFSILFYTNTGFKTLTLTFMGFTIVIFDVT